MATLLGGIRLVHLRPFAVLARVRPLLGARSAASAPVMQMLVEEALRSESEHDRYAARHLIHRTLDTKAHLRRLAPSHPRAARRYRELTAELFSGRYDAFTVLRWHDILQSIEHALNAFERTADIVTGIQLKHS